MQHKQLHEVAHLAHELLLVVVHCCCSAVLRFARKLTDVSHLSAESEAVGHVNGLNWLYFFLRCLLRL